MAAAAASAWAFASPLAAAPPAALFIGALPLAAGGVGVACGCAAAAPSFAASMGFAAMSFPDNGEVFVSRFASLISLEAAG
jgi:hypothetical protein